MHHLSEVALRRNSGTSGWTKVVYKSPLPRHKNLLLLFLTLSHARFSSNVLQALLYLLSITSIIIKKNTHSLVDDLQGHTRSERSSAPFEIFLSNCIGAKEIPKYLEQQRNMSHSPATPDKIGMHASGSESRTPLPSTDKLTSTSKIKQASLHEPSPASTYGDTIVGGSSPATPLDVGSHGRCMPRSPSVI